MDMDTWSEASQNVSDGDRKGSITARRVVWFPLPLRCSLLLSRASSALCVRSGRVLRAAERAGGRALQAAPSWRLPASLLQLGALIFPRG